MDIILEKALRRNWRTYFITLAITADIVALLLATAISILIRENLSYPMLFSVPFLWKLSIGFNSLVIGVALLVGVYRALFHSNLEQQYFLLSKAYIFAVFLMLFFMVTFFANSFPRKFTLIYLIIVPFSLALSRLILYQFDRYMQKKGFGINHALIMGDADTWKTMIERSRIFPELGYKTVGLVVWGNKKTLIADSSLQQYEDLPVYSSDALQEVIDRYNIQRIFLSTSVLFERENDELVEICERNKVKLKVVTRDAEDMLRFSRVHDISGIPLYAPERRKIESGKMLFKRVFDFSFGFIALLCLLPLLALIALCIYIEDRGSIIYKQKRALAEGKGDFYFYKFRSMKPNADELQDELYKQNETSGGLFMMESDPRVTRVGKFLRKYSLDELPQFFNVLKGDMSIVGPRPLSLADINNITAENSMRGYYALRAKVKPGITGLWQISGRREVHFREMVLLDLYYIENQSILFDMEIILETIPVVLFGRGAY